MNITNSQIKALIDIYTMINNAKTGYIPIADISNKYTIERFEKVLNDLLTAKIQDNNTLTDYYIKTKKEITKCKIK